MARSRKMPPLFEVMRETDRRAEAGRAPAAPGTILPRVTEPVSVPATPSAPLRLSEEGPAAASGAVGSSGAEGEDIGEPLGAGGSGAGKVSVPLPILLTSVGILIGVVALIAVMAFNAGAKRERSQLLTGDSDPPAVQPEDAGVRTEGDPAAPAPKTGSGDGPRPAPRTTPSKAVFGDDPREPGKNYLIVERLSFDDAVAAAQFLTDNGVACVVVAPEGTDPAELAKQPRGLWQVISRTGFTRDEFRASDTRVSDLKKEVIRLGRRWKQDHKGSSDFTNSLWDKFGK